MVKIKIKITDSQLSAFAGHILGYNLGKEYSGRKDTNTLDEVMEQLQKIIIPKCAKITGESEQSFYNRAKEMIVNSPIFEIYKKAQ